jgi:hypothetical protein
VRCANSGLHVLDCLSTASFCGHQNSTLPSSGTRVRTSVIVLNVISSLASLALAGLDCHSDCPYWRSRAAGLPRHRLRRGAYRDVFDGPGRLCDGVDETGPPRSPFVRPRSACPRCPGCASRRPFCLGGDIFTYPLNFGCMILQIVSAQGRRWVRAQNAKYSARVDVFRFASNNRHHSVGSAGPPNSDIPLLGMIGSGVVFHRC